ncbi:hypothetical protein QC762_214000 [Podospora pseudocomata]|uniref:Methyltransferase n=1 Tax=Podospora pseudocomata TaxID=2093779 RepID=A0ABR0GP57_9PEZI|nr:hypothetical protein QC762_214000 [Podospora pseudocomata]
MTTTGTGQQSASASDPTSDGRTFQDPKKYLLPNDKQEKERLAKQHPAARVTGIDIDSITPAITPVPSNCTFQSNIDAQDGPWTFAPDTKFDFVHFRMILSCFTQPTQVFRSVYENLAPGGYVEIQDLCVEIHSPDGSASGTSFEKIVDLFNQGSLKAGISMTKSKNYKKWLQEIGFVDVEERLAEPGLPTTGWHENERDREIGEMGSVSIQTFIRKGMPAYLRAAGLDEAGLQELTEKAVAELKSGEVRAYYPFYVVYGRKPLD